MEPTDEEVKAAIRRFWAWVEPNEIQKNTPYPTEDPELRAKYSEKEIGNKMYAMVDSGVLDYGVSIRTAWIVGE